MLKGNAHGPALVAGDPEKSALLKVVHYDGAIKMPPTGKLRPEEIAALTAWVKMGAPWPATKGPGGPSNPGQAPDLILTPAQKNFWSFRPIVKRALPKVKNAAWCISPIDRFILAKLEEKGLKPAPAADRRTLIRRAYFDLIGLPPTPEAGRSLRQRQSARRLGESRRRPARQPALRRALGTPLARCGALRRLRTAWTRTSPSPTPTAIATMWSTPSTKTCRTISF